MTEPKPTTLWDVFRSGDTFMAECFTIGHYEPAHVLGAWNSECLLLVDQERGGRSAINHVEASSRLPRGLLAPKQFKHTYLLDWPGAGDTCAWEWIAAQGKFKLVHDFEFIEQAILVLKDAFNLEWSHTFSAPLQESDRDDQLTHSSFLFPGYGVSYEPSIGWGCHDGHGRVMLGDGIDSPNTSVISEPRLALKRYEQLTGVTAQQVYLTSWGEGPWPVSIWNPKTNQDEPAPKGDQFAKRAQALYGARLPYGEDVKVVELQVSDSMFGSLNVRAAYNGQYLMLAEDRSTGGSSVVNATANAYDAVVKAVGHDFEMTFYTDRRGTYPYERSIDRFTAQQYTRRHGFVNAALDALMKQYKP